MPFLQSSGAISIANLNSFFPGSGTAMSNFYRGGGRVPSTKTVSTVVREPSSGENWYGKFGAFSWNMPTIGNREIRWNGTVVYTFPSSDNTTTSVTVGSFTYFRGTLFVTEQGSYGTFNYYYGVWRTSGSSSTVSINGNIPTSGQISLSQFYGAEVP